MGGDENDSAIFNTTNQLKNAQKTLEEAQKALNLLNGTAPIAGTVMSISINPGDEVNAGTTVAVVSRYQRNRYGCQGRWRAQHLLC